MGEIFTELDEGLSDLEKEFIAPQIEPTVLESTSAELTDIENEFLLPQEDNSLEFSLEQSYGKDPVKAAETKRLSVKHELQPSLVNSTLESLSKMDKLSTVDYKRIKENNPAVRKFLENPLNAEITSELHKEILHIEDSFKPKASLMDSFGSGIEGMQSSEYLAGYRAYKENIPRLEEKVAKATNSISKFFYEKELEQQKRGLKESQQLIAESSLRQQAELKSPEFERFVQEKTFGGAISRLAKDPIDILSHGFAKSLAPMGVMLGEAFVGSKIGRTTGASIAGGYSSYQLEYKSGIAEGLQQAGVDITDPDALNEALDDKELMGKIHLQAQQKAVVVGSADALSMGIAGKALGATQMKNILAQAGVQAGLGAGGEAVGAIYSGQEIKPAEVLLEGLLELPGTPIEIAIATGKIPGFRGKDKITSTSERMTVDIITQEEEQSTLDQITESVAKVSEVSPEAAQELLQTIQAEHGIGENVYIQPEYLQEALVSGEYDLTDPMVVKSFERLAESISEDADMVSIPLGEYVQLFPQDQIIRDNVKLKEDSLSKVEIEDAKIDRDETVKRMLEQVDITEQERVESTALYEEITQELIDTGRMRPSEAKEFAKIAPAMYAQAAKNRGISIQEVYEKLNLRTKGMVDKIDPVSDEVLLSQAQESGYEGESRGEAQEWLDAVNAGYDVSAEARMARAKEQGFDVDTVYYHGTGANIKEFIPSINGIAGEGVYLSNDSQIANNYATIKGFDKKTANVMPVYIKAKNPYKTKDSLNIPKPSELKKQGYDAIFVEEEWNNGDITKEFIVFDPKNIRSTSAVFLAPESASLLAQDLVNRGSYQRAKNESLISLGKQSNATTYIHELGHFYLDMESLLSKEYGLTEDNKLMLDYLGAKTFDDVDFFKWSGLKSEYDKLKGDAKKQYLDDLGLTVDEIYSKESNAREKHELLANSFMEYIKTGKAPSSALYSAFRKMKAWFIEAYKSMRANNIELTPEITGVFDRMLASDEAIADASATFKYEEETIEGEKAGQVARETLQVKLLKQLKSRETKKWIAEHKEEIKIAKEDIAKEKPYIAEKYMRENKVDDQQAGEILNYKEEKKSKELNPKQDSLLVAIAKNGGLDRNEAYDQGVQFADTTSQTQVFGQPAFRKPTDEEFKARSFDEMSTKLAEDDYLDPDGRPYDPNSLLAAITEELAGNKKYSMQYEPSVGEVGVKPSRLSGLTVANGMDVNTVANITGYAHGEEMLLDVIDTLPVSQEAPRRANVVMHERYGDYLTDGTLEEEANLLSHNPQRGKAILEELRKLTRKEPAINREMLRKSAEEIINSMPMSRMRPEKYHRQEVKYAIESDSMKADGDIDGSIQAKMNQLVNFYLYREARNAVIQHDKIRARLQKMKTRKYNPQQMDVDHINNLHMYLILHDFRKTPEGMLIYDDNGKSVGAKESLEKIASWIKRQQEANPDGYVPQFYDPKLEMIANGLEVELNSYKDMSLDEVKSVEAMAKNIIANGKQNSLEAKEEQNKAETIVSDSIVKNAKPVKEVKKGSYKETLRNARTGYASEILLHAEYQTRKLDGFKDGGAAYTAIKRPIDDAVTQKLLPMEEKAGEDMSVLYEKHYTNKDLKNMNAQKVVKGTNKLLTKWESIGVILNIGTESNRQALLDSEVKGEKQFTETDIGFIKDSLDKRDFDFIQDVWNYIETYKSQLGDVAREATGIVPEWVEATPFVTKYGNYKGGYYPLSYDSSTSVRVTEEEINSLKEATGIGRFTKAQTKNGMLIERVGSGGRPVRLDQGVFHSHIKNTIRTIALTKPVMDVQRLLNSKIVTDAFTQTDQIHVWKSLDVWLKDSAAGEIISSDFTSKLLRGVRTGFSAAKLGYNVGTMLMQPLGILQSMPVVGYVHTWKGVAAVLSNAHGENGTIAQVQRMSAFMRERAVTFNKDIRDTLSAMNSDPTKPHFVPDVIRNNMFTGIVLFQRYVDVATWLGMYGKAKAENPNMSEEDLVNIADRSVARSQASGIFSDRTPIERGTISNNIRQAEFVRIWTALGSYFFAKANVMAEVTSRTDFKSPKSIAKFAGDTTLLFMVEALIVSLIRNTFPDDEDEIPKHLLKEVIQSALTPYPLLREIGSVIGGFDSGSSVGGFQRDIGKGITQLLQGEPDVALARSLNNIGGIIFKYPSSAINRVVGTGLKQADGDDVSPIDYLIWRKESK